MNTPARRDGTPDRRKRSDQPTRGGAGRDAGSRGARSAQRGETQRGASWGGSERGSSQSGGYRGGSQGSQRGSSHGEGGHRDSSQGGGYRGGSQGGQRGSAQGGGYRGGAQGESGYRGSSQGGGYRGSQGEGGYRGGSSQGGGYRGGSQGEGGYRGSSQGGSGQRGSSQGGGYRGGSQGEGGYRGSSQGGSGQRGSSQGGGYRGGSQGEGGYRGSSQGGAAQRGSSQGGYRGSSEGGAARRPAQSPTAGASARKAKNPKPERKVVAPTLLNNAKPAKRQHVEPVAESHVKLPAGEGERLQKVLAKAGVASRRAAEEMIEQGRVEVDGAIVTEQGLRIDPQTAVVRVDGTRVMVREELVHIALNKPKGWQSTMSDDLGRPCVGDIVAERIAAGQRLFHVGRLDADTEGLLLLTNDGDLAHRLMHPSFETPKTYLATVNGEVNKSIGKRLKDGIELEDGPAKVDKFQVLELGEGRSLVKLVLHEGRKHIVRRLLDAVGHPVTRLVRTNIGPVALGDQRPGTLRVLGRDEVGKLYEAVSL
ncbi:pseudouridine synthase [Nocardia sp. NPDC057440]|uniref:pseudouridine synthase n=1 Tax=Nocardia sp. NPDC057440 TaxID=3346134 RepID=UPI00366FDBEC